MFQILNGFTVRYDNGKEVDTRRDTASGGTDTEGEGGREVGGGLH